VSNREALKSRVPLQRRIAEFQHSNRGVLDGPGRFSKNFLLSSALSLAVLILGGAACTSEPEDPSLSLSESERAALELFIDELTEV
jgi:hypothetical protein